MRGPPRDFAELDAWLKARRLARPQFYSGDAPPVRHDSDWYTIAADGSVWLQRWLYGELAQEKRVYDSEGEAFADLLPRYYPGSGR